MSTRISVPSVADTDDSPGGSRLAPVHAQIEALSAAVLPLYEARLNAWFDAVDQALPTLPGFERDVLMAAWRLLRMERARLLGNTLRNLRRGFHPLRPARAAVTLDRELQQLTLRASEELDEKLAMNGIAQRARRRHREALTAIATQAELLATAGVNLPARAFDPAAIGEAFRAAFETLELPFVLRLWLYEQLERHLIDQLEPPLQIALRLLREREPEAPPPDRAVPVVDLRTLQRLRAIGANHAAPADAALAADILARLQGDDALALAQRLALIGRLCNELADAQLGEALRASLERLRWPLAKAALADGSFFTDPAHPLRALTMEAALSGQGARIAGAEALAESARHLDRLLSQIDIAAGFVASELVRLAPLHPAQIATFHEQLRQHEAARREALLSRLRRQVSQEIQQRGVGALLPSGAQLFLSAGWGPLLALRLLRGGPDSPAWRNGLVSLEEVFTALDPRSETPLPVREFEALINRLHAELFEAGMRAEKVDVLLQGLREGYDEARHAQAPSIVSASALVTAPQMLPGDGVIELPEFSAE